MVKKCKAVNAFGKYELKNKEVKKTQIDFDSPFDLFKKIYSKYPSSFF
jgi:anthranilate synthase component 1